MCILSKSFIVKLYIELSHESNLMHVALKLLWGKMLSDLDDTCLQVIQVSLSKRELDAPCCGGICSSESTDRGGCIPAVRVVWAGCLTTLRRPRFSWSDRSALIGRRRERSPPSSPSYTAPPPGESTEIQNHFLHAEIWKSVVWVRGSHCWRQRRGKTMKRPGWGDRCVLWCDAAR